MITDRIKRPLRDWLWRKLALGWRLSSGVKIEVRSHGDWYIYNEIFVGGEYDIPLGRLIEECAVPGAQPAVVLDLGANVGFFFLRWLHLWRTAGSPGVPPRFFLVEGSGRSCAEITRRLAAQPACGAEVRVMHNLVGARSGSAVITDSHVHFGNQVTAEPKGGTTVPYVDLVELCRDFGEIALLKCDIEGSEEKFIESQLDLLAKTRAAVVELHHHSCDTARCERLIQASGLAARESLREEGDFSVLHFRRA